MRQSILVLNILIVFISCSKKSQESSPENRVEKTHHIPELKNWFLSTGNWEKDPQLFVREFGSGQDTVVMLHGGWGAEHSGLVNAVSDLGGDFRFIFYEQRGSLRSPFPDSLITFQQHINDLELLRKELKLDKMTLAGHSMGTVLASAYALEYPDHIKNLVLLAPSFLKQPFPDENQPIKHQGYLKSMEFRNRKEVTQELEKYNLNRENPPLSSKEKTMKSRIKIAALMLYDITKWNELNNGKAIFKSNVYALTEKTYPEDGWDYYKEFGKRTYPISIIAGSHDWLDFDGAITKEWIKEVPRIKLTMIQNAGHDLWIDQPENLSKTLRKSFSYPTK